MKQINMEDGDFVIVVKKNGLILFTDGESKVMASLKEYFTKPILSIMSEFKDIVSNLIQEGK